MEMVTSLIGPNGGNEINQLPTCASKRHALVVVGWRRSHLSNQTTHIGSYVANSGGIPVGISISYLIPAFLGPEHYD
jgi:hypothetical protein